MQRDGELYFRPARQDEFALILQFLKDAALWLREKQIDYWQDWLDPPVEFVSWIKEGFGNNEFYLICQASDAIGCFRLQWTDELFWGQRDEASGYVHSFTIARHLAGQHIGERALSLIEDYCRQQGNAYLRLDCGKHVARLCQYYEAYGFCNVGETTVQGESLTLYEKRITYRDHMQIRVATPDDENEVVDLLNELMILEKAELLSDEEFKKMYRVVINNSERALFIIAEIDSNTVGMLTMVFGFSTWKGKTFVTIDDVYVRQEMRRRGIATALLNFAFKIAKDLDCARVDLVTGIDNFPAQQLYKKLGFLPLPRTPFTKSL